MGRKEVWWPWYGLRLDPPSGSIRPGRRSPSRRGVRRGVLRGLRGVVLNSRHGRHHVLPGDRHIRRRDHSQEIAGWGKG